MRVGHWHPGIIGVVWTLDGLLLLMLVPDNASAVDLLIAFGLWAVPTMGLGLGTLVWWRHRRHLRRDA